jgi:hypothetical protein
MTSGPLDAELRRAFDALSERLRSEIAQQLNTTADELATVVEAEQAAAAARAAEHAHAAAQSLEEARAAEKALEDARAATEQAHHARTRLEEELSARHREELAAAERDAHERGRAEGLEQARGDMHAAERATSERLADAVRAIDRAGSLSEILDTLVSCAGREVSRAAVLVLQDGALRGWRFIGFDRSFDAAPEIRVPLERAGIMGDAISSGTLAAAASGASSLPEFAKVPDGTAGVAVPVLVGGQAVAILYADQGGSNLVEPGPWRPRLEVLARHAGRALESVTAFRTAQVLTEHPRMPRPAAFAAAQRTAGEDEDEAARRYARLLVSEIKLYHEPEVSAGRRERDLMGRLGGEIARARTLFEQRVPAHVRQRTDHFHAELVRTLAEGDPTLLNPQSR